MAGEKKFQDKALELYPIWQETPVLIPTTVGGLIRYKLWFKNRMPEKGGKKVTFRPALADVISQKERIAPQQWTNLKNVFLVTDSASDAKLATCYLCDARYRALRQLEEEEDDFYFGVDDIEDETIASKIALYEVSLATQNEKEQDDRRENTCTLALVGQDQMNHVFYYGLEDRRLREQLDIIQVSPVEFRCIQLSAQMAKMPEIRGLLELYPEENLLIELGKTDPDYYVNVCETLLDGEEVAEVSREEIPEIVLHMIRHSGGRFSEEWMGHLLDKGFTGKGFDRKAMFGEDTKAAGERLAAMPGLENFKRTMDELCALMREESRNPLLKLHRNMLFIGNPGSGKTTGAQIAAEILAGTGVTNPVFVAPSRSALIGRFVGQTAPKVKAAFDAARGGVLFIDEAGFFLNTQSGGYVQEAVKEFVRYMEMYPDVTVIFAMYTHEASDFLKLDEGLRSRITRVVKFEDYSTDELCQIADYMFQENGYSLGEIGQTLEDYFAAERSKEDFGNARAVRKLVESVILSVSLAREKQDRSMEISAQAVNQGIRRLKRESLEARNHMGFLSVKGGAHESLRGLRVSCGAEG